MSSRPSARDSAAPCLFVLTAPSGAGKTTLVHALTAEHPDLRFSISYTTRPQRRQETHGVDYLFVSEQEFTALEAAGKLLESAEVFDNRYGTSREQVERYLADGHPVILEIDWQGARQVRESMPTAHSVFILPPSRGELEHRLRQRGTDSEAAIDRRLADALADMSHWDEFDYVIVNDDLRRAVADLEAVLAGTGTAHASGNPALKERIADIVNITGL